MIMLETLSVLPRDSAPMPICWAQHKAVTEVERLVEALLTADVPAISCRSALEEIESYLKHQVIYPVLSPSIHLNPVDHFNTICGYLAPRKILILGSEPTSFPSAEQVGLRNLRSALLA